MNPTMNGDYEDALRRALHAAADSVEPSADGLERIRERIHRPMLSMSSASAWYASVTARLAAALQPVVDRFRPEASRPGHARPRSTWLRPAAAMGTAVFVVAAGGYALTRLPEVVTASGANSSSGVQHAGGGQHAGGSGGNGTGLVSGASSATAGSTRSGATPAASSCAPLGRSLTGSPGTSVKPTVTPSISTTPASTPPVSPDPSPSTSVSNAPVPGNTIGTVRDAALTSSAGTSCPSPAPTQKKKPVPGSSAVTGSSPPAAQTTPAGAAPSSSPALLNGGNTITAG